MNKESPLFLRTDHSLGGIFTAEAQGAPMQWRNVVEVTLGAGIKGDRYEVVSVDQDGENESRSRGFYSGKRVPDRDRAVSIISTSGIIAGNNLLRADGFKPLSSEETRRNFFVHGITPEDLNVLIGQRFEIGGVPFIGTELCTPCKRPTQLRSGIKSNVEVEPTEEDRAFMKAFKGKGGIRAVPLGTGLIYNTDVMTIERLNTHRWLK